MVHKAEVEIIAGDVDARVSERREALCCAGPLHVDDREITGATAEVGDQHRRFVSHARSKAERCGFP